MSVTKCTQLLLSSSMSVTCSTSSPAISRNREGDRSTILLLETTFWSI